MKAYLNKFRYDGRFGVLWTESELSYLRRNYKDTTDREIAEVLGRSRVSVIMKRSRLLLRKRQARGSGQTYHRLICQLASCGRVFWRTRKNIKYCSQQCSNASHIKYDINEARRLYALGYTQLRISQAMGCHPDTIAKMSRFRGLYIIEEGAA